MSIFGRNSAKPAPKEQGSLATIALNAIADGVMLIDAEGKVQFMNPAGLALSGYTSSEEVVGLAYTSVLKFEDAQGAPMADAQNPLVMAVNNNEAFSARGMMLVSLQGKKTPVALALTLAGPANKILTFRNIEKELKEESEQTEFISTASHEMRTPVASIEGYLGLALNPACATIDDRAKKYLTEAHNASQHLGRLFRDLLDVTKLDDQRMRAQLQPVDMNDMVKKIAGMHITDLGKKQIQYVFGNPQAQGGDRKFLVQALYASVDIDFLKEVLDNLLENAGKYTPAGGQVNVSVNGETDRVVIAVKDSGIGIAPADLKHIFQKFYRVDNSQTRTIGGTGLGLYIAKMRTESMGGKIWAESDYGHGSTFYVSLPRLSSTDYTRQKQIFDNNERMRVKQAAPAGLGAVANNATFATTPEVLVPKVAPVQPTAPSVSAAPTTPTAPSAPVAPEAPAAPMAGVDPNDPATSVQDLSAEKLAEAKARFAEQMKAANPSGQASNGNV